MTERLAYEMDETFEIAPCVVYTHHEHCNYVGLNPKLALQVTILVK